MKPAIAGCRVWWTTPRAAWSARSKRCCVTMKVSARKAEQAEDPALEHRSIRTHSDRLWHGRDPDRLA